MNPYRDYMTKHASRAWRLAASAGKVSPYTLERWHPAAAVIAHIDEGLESASPISVPFRDLAADRKARERIANSRWTVPHPKPRGTVELYGSIHSAITQQQVKDRKVLSLPNMVDNPDTGRIHQQLIIDDARHLQGNRLKEMRRDHLKQRINNVFKKDL